MRDAFLSSPPVEKPREVPGRDLLSVSCTRPRSVPATALRVARLRPGRAGGTRQTCLPLLPPGPDGVHRQHVAPGPAINVGQRGRLPRKADLSSGIPPRIKRFSGYRAPLVPRLARYICHCLALGGKTATRAATGASPSRTMPTRPSGSRQNRNPGRHRRVGQAGSRYFHRVFFAARPGWRVWHGTCTLR